MNEGKWKYNALIIFRKKKYKNYCLNEIIESLDSIGMNWIKQCYESQNFIQDC